jgi:hypothetical protein
LTKTSKTLELGGKNICKPTRCFWVVLSRKISSIFALGGKKEFMPSLKLEIFPYPKDQVEIGVLSSG